MGVENKKASIIENIIGIYESYVKKCIGIGTLTDPYIFRIRYCNFPFLML